MKQSKFLPLVSIALCTFNGESYINQQLQSIITQTYQILEIIICDDGSKDSTLDILYKEKDPRIKIIESEKNLGLEANFFKAISLCKGEYIALADQDDIWMEDKIEKLVNIIGDHTLVYANSEFMDQDGKLTGNKISDLRRMYSGTDNRIFSINTITCLYGHAMLFTSNLKPYLNFFPGVSHDTWIGFVALTHGSIFYLDEVLVHYRQHDGSVTRKPSSEKSDPQQNLIYWFKALYDFENSNHKEFFFLLLNRYTDCIHKNKKFQFFKFLFQHQNILFYTKPGMLSRLNQMRKLLRRP